MRYFLLVERIEAGDWHIVFGDYEKDVVKQELIDHADSTGIAKRKLAVLACPDDSLQALAERVAAWEANH